MSYAARFECAICQGTLPDSSFCALDCGHCFHTVCVYTWLERSPTCPGCRASAKKRHVKALNGVDVVVDASEATHTHLGSEQQCLHHQQEVEQLQQQLAAAEQNGQDLAAVITQLEGVQHSLQEKVKKYKHRCSELEGQRLQDAARLTAVNTELSKLKDMYWSKKGDVDRLRHDLKAEQDKRVEAEQRRRRAEASGLQLQLQNPSLSLKAMQQLLNAQDQGLQGLDRGQLLVTLASRNEQLKKAEERASQLQQQVQQQQCQADALRDEANSRQVAMEARAAKQQEECMKQVIHLEYQRDKLEGDNAALRQQLQELQGVLLALEGGGAATAHRQHCRQQQWRTAPQQPVGTADPTPQEPGITCSQSSSQKENDPAAAQQQQQDIQQAADEWRADVGAAVGPGSLLHRPAHMVQAPSFVKPGVATAGVGLHVTGSLVNRGPDGRGGTILHLTSAGKRGNAREPMNAANKKARGATSATANITRFFGKSN